MVVANTLAYYATATIMSLESIIVQAPGSLKLDYFIAMKLLKMAKPKISDVL